MIGGNQEGRSSLGRRKVLAVSVPALVSFFVWWSVLGVLPSWVSVLAVLAVLVGAVTVSLVPLAEPAVVRLLYRARSVTGADRQALAPTMSLLCGQGLGPPLLRFYVRQGGLEVPVVGVGGNSVVVTRGLIDALQRAQVTAEQAAVSAAPAAALVRSGAARTDAAILIWVLPWMALREVGTMLLRAVGLAAVLRLGWRARWVVGAMAVVQALQASQGAWAAVVATIAAVTYAWPRWVAAWRICLFEFGAAAAAQVASGADAGTSGGASSARVHREPTEPRSPVAAAAPTAGGRPRLTLVR